MGHPNREQWCISNASQILQSLSLHQDDVVCHDGFHVRNAFKTPISMIMQAAQAIRAQVQARSFRSSPPLDWASKWTSRPPARRCNTDSSMVRRSLSSLETPVARAKTVALLRLT